MIARFKKRWLTPKMLGVLLAKLILSGSTGLAALTVHSQQRQAATPHFVSFTVHQSGELPAFSRYRELPTSYPNPSH